ncbi:MAG: SusC/RagA family TonB-linked outer membrane protein, partial [Tannerella sp.]|nr:SusC/RagA family TonB-linked outer membrane protein [Tannerella sp.]
IYEDWNGDGVIDDRDNHPIATTTSSDASLPGSDPSSVRNYPLMNFGVTLGGQWKWIDFNLLFQGAGMSYVAYGDQLREPLAWDGNALELLFDRWHPADPDKDPYDPANQWIVGYYPYGKTRAETNSEFNIQSGAYLRLKSVELGFTLPRNIVTGKLGVTNLRLFVNTYNLLTITGVRGLDPEKPSETGGYIYPLNRTFNFGGTLTF